MKSVLVWASLGMLALAGSTAAAPVNPQLATVAAPRTAVPVIAQISGHDYVSVTAWAKANGLEAQWLTRGKSLQLTNRSIRILFTGDANDVILDATVNQTLVKLLFPVVKRDSLACLSQADVQNTFQPLLHPPRNRPGSVINTICLDPGHGGKDPGAHFVGDEAKTEKTYTLLLAQELRDQLTRAGLKVVMTRTKDTFVELPDRPAFAKQHKADLFISMHFNSSSSSVRGAEVYCMTPVGAPSSNAAGQGARAGAFAGNQDNARNLLLAYEIQKMLAQIQTVEDRGVRWARDAVLRDAVMPAVLVESGYLSNPVEGKKILDSAYRKRLAKGIADGILAYKRIVEGT